MEKNIAKYFTRILTLTNQMKNYDDKIEIKHIFIRYWGH